MKVNDYVRTKDGLIHKITDVFNTTKQVATDKGKYVYEYNEIVKSSPNIIDLIEIGDIVTFKGEYIVYNVISLPDKEVGLDVFYLAKQYDGETEDIEISKELMQKYIYSIVTKEQFKSMEYKVGEDNDICRLSRNRQIKYSREK